MPVARALAAADGAAGMGEPDRISDQDVRWLLETAGSYIVEDLGPGGRSVYRPFHDLLAAHLRGEPPREQIEEDSRRGGMAAAAGPDRDGDHPRAARHAVHRTVAAVVGRAPLPADLSCRACNRWPAPEMLLDLVADPEFLSVANPVTLIPLLSVADPRLRDAARVYLRAFPLLNDNPRANLAYLQEAAVALHIPTPAVGSTGIRPAYRTRMTAVRRDDSLLALTGHTGAVNAVAFGTGAAGRPLLASAGSDGTVRLWDPDIGAPVGQPLTGHTSGVGSVAFGAGAGGRPLLASADGGGNPLLAFIAGDRDGTVRLWDPDTGALVGQLLTGHWVSSVAFGAGGGGRPLLASAGDHDGTVRLWDPDTGAPVGQLLTGHRSWVNSVAFGAGAGGRPLLASAGHDGTVRLWDLDTGAPVGQLLTGHSLWLATVAFGAGADGRPLLAFAGYDGTVRLWDLDTGAPVGELLTGHTGAVGSVAFGAGAGGRPLLASAGHDGTVRLWDLDTGARSGRLLSGHTGAVNSVAFGAGAGGRPLLASAGDHDGKVRLWDLDTGAPAVGCRPATLARWTRWRSARGRGGGRCWPPPATTGRCGCGTRRPAPRSASRLPATEAG